VLGFIFIRPLAVWLGAEGQLLEDCVLYGKIILVALPFYILQMEFQSFFVAAEKSNLGLVATVISGVTNIVLDALFIAVLEWGIWGASAATALSQVVGGIVPIIYFSRQNTSRLRLVKCKFDGYALFKTCTNGASELMSNISMSAVGMLYNVQLLGIAQENGVSAYGVLMYVSFAFLSIFIGFAIGSAPIISYHYGAKNKAELKSLLKKSSVIILAMSVLMFAAGELLGRPFSILFVGYDDVLLDMTAHGFAIFSVSFLFSGFAIFGSSFFTALNDGITSAIISFFRTLVFQVGAVLILPLIWGLDGIWWSIVVAEVMAMLFTVLFLILKKNRYGYM